MARFKDNDRDQGLMLPIHYSDQLIPGTIEYAIDDIVDNYIDTARFAARYNNDIHGAKAYNPSVLLKILLMAYARGCNTSRKIEELCRNNVLFIALSGHTQPDHSTIASFISTMREEISGIFTDILIRCAQLDLIGGELFALDGCKISTNAAKEMSGTFKELERKKLKLQVMCDKMLETHIKNDGMESSTIEKRIRKYRAKINKIDAFLRSSEPKKGKRTGENKSNITDNESAKMKTSQGIQQGYNGIALVDEKHQIIMHAEAFGQVSEADLLPGILKRTENLLKGIDEEWAINSAKIVADTGYFSESNCEYLESMNIEGYIPDKLFRKRDPRFPAESPYRKAGKKNLFGHDKFTYNSKTNCYVCPMGNILKFDGKKNMHGYIGRRYVIKDKSCHTCHLKTECLRKGAKVRTLFITDIPRPKTYSEKMIEKIDTSYGREIYSRRMGIVEPVFANIRYCKRLNRFTLRSKEKVTIQWMLYCCVHNIEKTLKAAA